MRNVYYTILVFVCLISSLSAKASTRAEGDSGFKDIKLNLMNGNFLSDEEINNKTQVTFGIAIAEDGTPTRVAADDATANIILNNYKYHSNEHGFNPGTATVKVQGPVKISIGACAYGNNVTIKNEAGDVITTIAINSLGSCYHNNGNPCVEGYYTGKEATTLSISGGGYIHILASKQSAKPRKNQLLNMH